MPGNLFYVGNIFDVWVWPSGERIGKSTNDLQIYPFRGQKEKEIPVNEYNIIYQYEK
jgi:hypothetical protein